MEFQLSAYGRAFSTRPRGAELLAELERVARDGATVDVDFSDVLSVSYSFADEFVGRLLEREQAGEIAFHPRVVNVSPAIERVIQRSVAARGVAPAPLV